MSGPEELELRQGRINVYPEKGGVLRSIGGDQLRYDLVFAIKLYGEIDRAAKSEPQQLA